MTQARLMRLRYPAICSSCRKQLTAGSQAEWDKKTRKATCSACVHQGSEFRRGEAGASAERRHARLRKGREQRARNRLGQLSGLYLSLTGEPQSTKAWATGAAGERALGRYLETLHNGESIVILHDRLIPQTRANIDHIAIAPSGVYAIDAKNYQGKVQRVDKGGLLSTDWRLQVGTRDCTKLVRGMDKQVDAVRAAVGRPLIEELDLSVHAALCFVDAEWSLFARPFEIDGVWTGWAKALGKRLQTPGPLEPGVVDLLARRLAAALPRA